MNKEPLDTRYNPLYHAITGIAEYAGSPEPTTTKEIQRWDGQLPPTPRNTPA